MDVPVASCLHRKLRRMERYVRASEISSKAQVILKRGFAEIVGCYRNDRGTEDDWIVFTTNGISAVFDGEWRSIPYSEIRRVVREKTKDVDADEITLELRSMSRATFVVNGKDPERGTHDKYLIMMFLGHVI